MAYGGVFRGAEQWRGLCGSAVGVDGDFGNIETEKPVQAPSEDGAHPKVFDQQ